VKRTGGMVQIVECLPSKPEVLSSNFSIKKRKKKEGSQRILCILWIREVTRNRQLIFIHIQKVVFQMKSFESPKTSFLLLTPKNHWPSTYHKIRTMLKLTVIINKCSTENHLEGKLVLSNLSTRNTKYLSFKTEVG
jgi:hypothetical protein